MIRGSCAAPTEGWIVSAETVHDLGGGEQERSVQFWLATYADASDAVAAVRRAPGLARNAHVEAKAKAAPGTLKAIGLASSQVKLLAP